jgi:hypothetical protein
MPDLRAIDPARLAAIGHAIGGRREAHFRAAPEGTRRRLAVPLAFARERQPVADGEQ